MVNILTFVVVAALCVTAAVGAPSSPIGTSCAILDSSWALWDVSSSNYNVDDDHGSISANLCLDIEKSCAHTSNDPCTVCQFIEEGHSYCVGFSRNEVYSPLNKTIYRDTLGFRATLQGDNCGGFGDRITYIDVLCGRDEDRLVWKGEGPTCTYNFQLYQKKDCAWSASSFMPTFSIPSITSTAIQINIDDGYPYMYWSYTIKLNGVLSYTGDNRMVFLENLSPNTEYTVVVERVSGTNAIQQVTAPSNALKIRTTTGPSSNSNVVISEKGAGIAIGMVITVVIVVALFGFYRLTRSGWWADKFGGGKKGGFSLMDAEKSSAFE